MEFKKSLEQDYKSKKETIEALQAHMKSYRSELNKIADSLLDNETEYVFSTGDLVLKKPTTHKSQKINLN